MSWDNNYGGTSYGGYDAGYGGYSDNSQNQQQPTDGNSSGFDMYGQGGGGYDPQYNNYNDPYNQQPPSGGPQQQQQPPPHQQTQQQGGGVNSSGGGGYPQGAQAMMAGMMDPNSLMANPMVKDMAMQYGAQFTQQGQEQIQKHLDKYISIGQLKYYFAVDTSYVARKLAILLFPFARNDWTIKYNQEEPVQPKYDVNAPDLYIPSMAYMTYILIVGYILGLRDAFSPDLLATTASSTLVWLVLELVVIYLTLTVMSINTTLTKWDIVSFSAYKYVAMIVVLLTGLLLQSKLVYYVALIYVSAALGFFLLRTLKLGIEPEVHGMQNHGKRKLYVIFFYAGLQPLLIWWLTSYLVPVSTTIEMPSQPLGFETP